MTEQKVVRVLPTGAVGWKQGCNTEAKTNSRPGWATEEDPGLTVTSVAFGRVCLHGIREALASTPAFRGKEKKGWLLGNTQLLGTDRVSFWSDEHSDVMVAQFSEHTETSVTHLVFWTLVINLLLYVF